jgi:hypothetical protein
LMMEERAVVVPHGDAAPAATGRAGGTSPHRRPVCRKSRGWREDRPTEPCPARPGVALRGRAHPRGAWDSRSLKYVAAASAGRASGAGRGAVIVSRRGAPSPAGLLPSPCRPMAQGSARETGRRLQAPSRTASAAAAVSRGGSAAWKASSVRPRCRIRSRLREADRWNRPPSREPPPAASLEGHHCFHRPDSRSRRMPNKPGARRPPVRGRAHFARENSRDRRGHTPTAAASP